MSFQAGNAYITVTPSMRGFQRTVQRGIENSQLGTPAQRKGREIGDEMGKGVTAGSRALGQSIAGAFRSASSGVARAATSIGQGFMTYVARPIARGARGLARAVTAGFGNLKWALQPIASSLGNFFMERVAAPIAGGARRVGSALSTAFSTASAVVGRVASTVGEFVMDRIVAPIAGGARRVGSAFSTAFSTATGAVGRAASSVGTFFMDRVASPIREGGRAVGSAISNSFGMATTAVGSTAIDVGRAFMARVPEPIRESASRLHTVIGTTFLSAREGVVNAASRVGSFFTDGLGARLSSAASTVSSAVGTAFSGVYSVASTVGGNVARVFSGALTGIGDSLQALGPQIAAMGGQFQAVGQQISGLGGTLTKAITIPIGGATVAAGGLVATLGWGRLTSLDTAQAQLRGLGYEAADVDRITGQLVDDLEGGMMTMGDATSAAAGAMAAGVQEGAELTKYIQMLDAAVVGGNGTFYEMNNIFSRTADLGYLNANNFDMMAQRMPGFSSAMQEHTGKSGDAFRAMLNEGEISLEEFLDVMDDFGGDMATEYANSWEGMVANTKNYIGILGENLLGGVFEQSKDSIAEFIDYLSSDEVAQWATEMGESIGRTFSDIVGHVRTAIDWWMNLDGSTRQLILTLGGIAVAAGPALLIFGKFAGAIGNVLRFVGPMVSGIGSLVSRFGALIPGAGGASGAMGGLGTVLRVLTGPIGWITAGLAAIWVASEDFRESVFNLGRTIWDSLVSAFEMLWPYVQNLWGSLQDLWGSMSQGGGILDGLGTALSWVVDLLGWFLGIAIDVAGYLLTGLVVALDYVVQGFSWVADAAVGVIAWFSDLGTWLLDGFMGGWDGAIGAVMGAIGDFFMGIIDWVKNLFGINSPSTVFADFGRWIIEGLGQGISSMLGWLIDAASGIWDALTSGLTWMYENIWIPVWGGIQSVVAWVVDYFQNIVIPVWSAIFETIGGILSWMYENIWLPVWDGIKTAASLVSAYFTEILIPVYQRIFEAIGGALSWMYNNIWLPVWGWIKSAASAFTDWWAETGWPAIQRGFEIIGDVAMWVWNNLLSPVIGWLSDRLSDFVEWWSTTGSERVSGAWSSFADTVSNVWHNYISPVLGWLWDKMRDFTVWWAETGWPAIRDAWTAFRDTVVRIWNNYLKPPLSALWDLLRDLTVWWAYTGWPAIRDAFTAFRDTVVNVWRNHIRPTFQRLRDAWGAVRDTFVNLWRNHIRPMFQRFRDFVRGTYERLRDYFQRMSDRWNSLKDSFIRIYQNNIQPLFQRFGDFVGRTRERIGNAFTRIRDSWAWLRDRLRDIWRNNIRPIFQAVGDFVRVNLVDRIRDGIGAIKRAWDRMGGIFRKPIKWVIDNVWNKGLRRAYNAVANVVGITTINPINNIESVPRFATGGPVRGPGTGTSDDILAKLSDGEHVLTDAEVKALGGHGAVFDLRSKIMSGELLNSSDMDSVMAAQQSDLTPAGSKRMSDMARRDALPMGGWWDDLRSFGSNAWTNVKGGAAALWDTTKDAAGNVIEWVQGGLKKAAESFLNPILQPLKNQMGDAGLLGDIAVGAFNKLKDGIFSFAGSKDDEHNSSMMGGQGLSGMDAFLWALRQVESNNNYTATNPFSDASGAYQFISSTWGGYRGYRRAADAPPAVQDARARLDANRFYRQYGSWDQVAAAWLYPALAGNRSAWGRSPGVGNPSIQSYVNRVMSSMRIAEAPVGGGAFTANPGGFNRPMQGPITSRAGNRAYQGRFGGRHYGVDIAGPIGTAVRAMFSGVVKRTGGSGNDRIMVLNHGGYDTAYMHMSRLLKSVGAQVKGGDLIARSGTAGSGPHGHFEYHPGGYYNPSQARINSLFRDKGGLIYPGMNQVLNETGGAEYVTNQRQFDNLMMMAESATGGEGWTINQNNYQSGSQYRDAQDLRMTFRRERKKAGV